MLQALLLTGGGGGGMESDGSSDGDAGVAEGEGADGEEVPGHVAEGEGADQPLRMESDGSPRLGSRLASRRLAKHIFVTHALCPSL